MKAIIRFSCAAAALACLSACTQQQLTTTDAYVSAVCSDYQIALAADPALSTHNPQLVKDGTTACAVAPAIVNSVPPKS